MLDIRQVRLWETDAMRRSSFLDIGSRLEEEASRLLDVWPDRVGARLNSIGAQMTHITRGSVCRWDRCTRTSCRGSMLS